MKRAILFFGMALCALAAVAEARSWGFDKDTVYEWRAGGDTVRLVNNGSDTLWLDSVFAEDVDATFWLNVHFVYQALGPPFSQDFSYSYNLVQGFHVAEKMAGDKIPPGQTVLFRQFDVSTPCPTAKTSEDDSWAGDTLKVRLRFTSTAAETDTLTVMGNVCVGSSIILLPNRTRFSVPIVDRDALGRRSSPSRSFPVLIKLVK